MQLLVVLVTGQWLDVNKGQGPVSPGGLFFVEDRPGLEMEPGRGTAVQSRAQLVAGAEAVFLKDFPNRALCQPQICVSPTFLQNKCHAPRGRPQCGHRCPAFTY
jgi:hypothetical protein|mmetsp:Transcript_65292/g.108430  ORF Transcript_65292/g.108430 Transcript_65292/m.108430 type:complete len:104 (-) Transcript_65292:57-368(-)